MKLFEVDLGSARDILAVLKGQADKKNQPSTIPFPVIMNLLKRLGLGISTPDGLIALKNKIDPAGDVIADILDSGAVVLNTKAKNPNQDSSTKQTKGPSIDAMAASNTDLTPNI